MAATTRTAPDPVNTPAPRPPWWRRPWIAPLAVVVAIFLATTLPRYVGLDPAQSLVPTDRGPGFYPALVTHILFGSVMLVCGVLQLWPWLRARHLRIHRWSGRAYVATAIPTALAALVTAQYPSAGPAQQVANTMAALLLLVFTVAGFRAVRRRRIAQHREWMIRSYAVGFSIVVNRFWGALLLFLFEPNAMTGVGPIDEANMASAAAASAWASWTVNLLFAEWWLHRRPRARARRADA